MKLKKELPYLCFILPAFLVYTVLMLYPMLQAVGLSFTDWKGVTFENLHFVGLKNYLDVFSDKQIIISIHCRADRGDDPGNPAVGCPEFQNEDQQHPESGVFLPVGSECAGAGIFMVLYYVTSGLWTAEPNGHGTGL